MTPPNGEEAKSVTGDRVEQIWNLLRSARLTPSEAAKLQDLVAIRTLKKVTEAPPGWPTERVFDEERIQALTEMVMAFEPKVPSDVLAELKTAFDERRGNKAGLPHNLKLRLLTHGEGMVNDLAGYAAEVKMLRAKLAEERELKRRAMDVAEKSQQHLNEVLPDLKSQVEALSIRPLRSFQTETLVQEANRRMEKCARGHAPELLAMWPCYRCTVEREREAARAQGRTDAIHEIMHNPQTSPNSLAAKLVQQGRTEALDALLVDLRAGRTVTWAAQADYKVGIEASIAVAEAHRATIAKPASRTDEVVANKFPYRPVIMSALFDALAGHHEHRFPLGGGPCWCGLEFRHAEGEVVNVGGGASEIGAPHTGRVAPEIYVAMKADDAARWLYEKLHEGNLWSYAKAADSMVFGDMGVWVVEQIRKAVEAPKFMCQASRFRGGMPGGGDPPGCDWPNCDCDPHIERVIAGLQECGYRVIAPSEVLTLTQVSEVRRDWAYATAKMGGDAWPAACAAWCGRWGTKLMDTVAALEADLLVARNERHAANAKKPVRFNIAAARSAFAISPGPSGRWCEEWGVRLMEYADAMEDELNDYRDGAQVEAKEADRGRDAINRMRQAMRDQGVHFEDGDEEVIVRSLARGAKDAHTSMAAVRAALLDAGMSPALGQEHVYVERVVMERAQYLRERDAARSAVGRKYERDVLRAAPEIYAHQEEMRMANEYLDAARQTIQKLNREKQQLEAKVASMVRMNTAMARGGKAHGDKLAASVLSVRVAELEDALRGTVDVLGRLLDAKAARGVGVGPALEAAKVALLGPPVRGVPGA